MATIPALNFRNVPLPGHYAFLSERFIPALSAAGQAVTTAVALLRPYLDEWLLKEKALLDWQRRSAYTQEIAEANDGLDHSLSALGASVKVHLYDDDDGNVAAANRLHLMLKSMSDYLHAAYETEVGAAQTVLGRLKGDLAPDVERLALGARVEKVQQAFDRFNALFNARQSEAAKKPALNAHAVRKGIEGVYRQIIALVNANANAGTSPDFGAFVAVVTPMVDYMNTQYKPAAKKAEAPAAQ